MPETNKAWICVVCGYIHRGPEPPEQCEVCGASQEEFEPYHESAGPPPAPGAADRVVVIGAGIAGVSAIESLRQAGATAAIVLVSREDELPYYRLNLTRYLAGEMGREALFLHPAEWYRQQNVELLPGQEVTSIRPVEHAVELRDGRRMPFDKLLLAAGATPFVPPIPGAELAGVTTLRTVADADRLLDACATGPRCVCIGGGLLGLETAGALARRGAAVTLLEGHGWLLPRQLNERAGQLLAERVAGLGIKLKRKAGTHQIVGDERVRGVVLDDGTTIAADVVVIATGVRANGSLAQRAGLAVKQGVVVDNRLVTSHPDVLAAGDVAEHQGSVYGLWTAAQAQGRVAGQNLAGAAAEFGGLPRATTLKVLGLDVFSMGRFAAEDARDQVLDHEADGHYFRFVVREGRLVGAILLGDTRLMPAVKKAVESRQDLSPRLGAHPVAQTVTDCLQSARPAPPLPAKPAVPRPRRYECPVCGYVFDEALEGRRWDDLPDDWVCPVCGEGKPSFQPVAE